MKIVLDIHESVYDQLICLSLSKKKNFSQVVNDVFTKDQKALQLYDEMCQMEFEKILKENL